MDKKGDGERERDRGDKDHHERSSHRDQHRVRSDRRDRGRDRDEGDYIKGVGDTMTGNKEDIGTGLDRSKDKYDNVSPSRSRSRSISKRRSGFDMGPPSLDGVAPGGPPATIPNVLPNMLPPPPGMLSLEFYVGGLSPMANVQSVATFFSQVMEAVGGNTAGPGELCKKFAFVEMRSVEEASNAMALDGIIFEGAPVKVRRPSDYNPSLATTLGPSQPSQILNLAAVGLSLGSAGVLEGPDRIFVGGLPYYFTEVQIRELLESFGPLRGFDLVKERETGNSKGYAFCVYQDISVTDIACAALNGIQMGDKNLTVRRANQGTTQPKPEQENVLLQAQQQVALQRFAFQAVALPTKVVCLTQVVSADELKDDEEYEDKVEDMRVEGGKFGSLMSVIIPRPMANGEPSPGAGKVFLEFSDTDGASKARTGLNGSKFGGNQVIAVHYPENKFLQGAYDA
ncbi:hypothetical protein MKX01_024882 [Papaver californicum]|nr:hypothetical protein MKX01_024882 [Papaver californicum]